MGWGPSLAHGPGLSRIKLILLPIQKTAPKGAKEIQMYYCTVKGEEYSVGSNGGYVWKNGWQSGWQPRKDGVTMLWRPNPDLSDKENEEKFKLYVRKLLRSGYE